MARIHLTRKPPSAGQDRAVKVSLFHRIEDELRYVAASLFGIFFLFCIVGIPLLMVITSTYGLGDMVKKKAEAMMGGKFYSVSIERVLFQSDARVHSGSSSDS